MSCYFTLGAGMELYLKAFRANLDVGVGLLQDWGTVFSFISDNVWVNLTLLLLHLANQELVFTHHSLKDILNFGELFPTLPGGCPCHSVTQSVSHSVKVKTDFDMTFIYLILPSHQTHLVANKHHLTPSRSFYVNCRHVDSIRLLQLFRCQ